MAESLLAVDPGTRRTGLAVFDGEKLSRYGLIVAPGYMEVDQRIGYMVSQLEKAVGPVRAEIRDVVAEQPWGIDQHRPAPELQTLVARLRRWTTRSHGWSWTVYHPSTVAASVRLRGVGNTRKEQIRAGVIALYSPGLPLDVGQDVVDAVAIGHCHIVKSRQLKLGG